MSRVRVGDLRELVKEDNIVEVEFEGLKIKIEKYLPISKKLELVHSIYNSCINEDDGLKVVNNNSKMIAFVYYITRYYTNINLPRNIFDAYDVLISTGIYSAIEKVIKDEIAIINDIFINVTCYEDEVYYQKNHFAYIAREILAKLVEKLPAIEEAEDFIEAAKKEVENFDPNKLSFIQEFVEVNKGK